MKTKIIPAIMLFCALCSPSARAQKAGKAMAPLFVVSKVEILCNAGGIRDARKKVHVLSNAGWSVFQNIGLRITDGIGTVIATYSGITGDFYTPPLPLSPGAAYTISLLDGSGAVIINSTTNPNPYSRTAPACGMERKLGPAPRIDMKAVHVQ